MRTQLKKRERIAALEAKLTELQAAANAYLLATAKGCQVLPEGKAAVLAAYDRLKPLLPE